MSFADYQNLKANVKSAYHNRSDIPDFVYELTTAELNAKLRLKVMESETTLTASSETTALPSDFLEVRHMYLDQDVREPIDVVDEFAKSRFYDISGQPREYTIINGSVLWNPAPDGSYSVNLRYYAKLSDFSADTDTNAVLTTFPALYFYGALKQIALWEGDDEAAGRYEAAFEKELRSIMKREQTARYGSGPLTSVSHAVG